MTTTPTGLAPLTKAARVPQPPAEAFRLFTEGIGAWWPLVTHSVGQERAVGVSLEPRQGGRIVETYVDDAGGRATTSWGTVLAWEPPARLRFTWHPGTPEDEATEVEVRFASAPGGGTAVELVHGGWDRRPDGASARASYDPGWDLVFGSYATHLDGALTGRREHPGPGFG